ncbi:hypothetical protein FOL47_009632 [Perkinsus chesapeaki]|uniref:DSBA-like thioredoxin domain-containing protein n=1 Tax=Perkinsus chesapeaki TaxID=330153 RepID=A0A7J6L768_PERCH|nr:hypothetical protein FOL47_009632 [Perkinsus chesapeaki]
MSPPPPRQLVVSVVADFVCPWCYIGHVEITRALQKVRLAPWAPSKLQLLHQPYSVYERPLKTPPKGELVIDYLADVYGVDQSFLKDPSLNASLAAAQKAGIELSWSRRVTDSTLAHQAVLSLQQQQQITDDTEIAGIMTRIYKAYFGNALDISDIKVLRDVVQKPLNLSPSDSVPWRSDVDGVPLVEVRAADEGPLVELIGEDIECDKIVDEIKGLCVSSFLNA